MKQTTKKITRRSFLKNVGLTSLAFTIGCIPRRTTWIRSVPGGKKLRIVFYTDVHTRTEWDTPLALQKAADSINAQEPDLVIAGGDLITDGFQSSHATVEPRWREYLKMHRNINSQVYSVLGNHDLVAAIPEDGTKPSENPRGYFLDTFDLEKTYCSFNIGGYHFILLDSIHVVGGELMYHGMIWPEQMEWLENDLRGISQDTPIVLATHIPLVTSFYQITKGTPMPAPPNRVIVNNKEVLKLFRNHNLILVLQGHLHVEEMIRFRNTMFITGGAICGKWWRGSWYGAKEGFCVITLNDNSVELEYINYGWQARRPVDQ